MFDFLLFVVVLIVVIGCVVFCYLLGVLEACKRGHKRNCDNEIDRRPLHSKGLAACVGCID